MTWTIFGATGLVGSHILPILQKEDAVIHAPTRKELSELKGKHLGRVIYCIGMTSNFRTNIAATFESHFSLLQKLITQNFCTSVTYLSSTRVYLRSEATAEDSPIKVNPLHSDDAYALSKLAGESFLIHSGLPIKIIRLSNVYGTTHPNPNSGNFIDSVMLSAAMNNRVVFQTHPSSEKDFIHILDAAKLIVKIAKSEEYGIFNVASGKNTTNFEIGNALSAAGISIDYDYSAPKHIFPQINISRIENIFNKPKHILLQNVKTILQTYKSYTKNTTTAQD